MENGKCMCAVSFRMARFSYRREAQCAPAQCSIMGLRAHIVRPYGYASANDFNMGTRLIITIILHFQFSIIYMVNENAL